MGMSAGVCWGGIGSGMGWALHLDLGLVTGTFPFPFIFTLSLESWRVGERQCITREGGATI